MNITPRNAVCLENGDIINNHTGMPVREPAMVIDHETGCVLSWGPKNSVYDAYLRMTGRYQNAGLNDMAEQLMYIELDEMRLTPEQRCYVLKRCVEYSASGFQTDLCLKIQYGDDGRILEWLGKEMARVPICLTDKN